MKTNGRKTMVPATTSVASAKSIRITAMDFIKAENAEDLPIDNVASKEVEVRQYSAVSFSALTNVEHNYPICESRMLKSHLKPKCPIIER